jgi:hypothetical protein
MYKLQAKIVTESFNWTGIVKIFAFFLFCIENNVMNNITFYCFFNFLYILKNLYKFQKQNVEIF